MVSKKRRRLSRASSRRGTAVAAAVRAVEAMTVPGSEIDHLLFDLDGTLYAIENGYELACRERLFEFMVERLGLPSKDAARELWRPHFATHNQSLKALRAAGFVVDSDEYWAYTRGDASTHLGANDDAIAFFESLMTRRGEEEEEEEEEEEGGGEDAGGVGGDGRRRRMRRIKSSHVLTNCHEKQGAEALAVLRLSGYFDRVYGAGHMGDDLAKPQIEAFELVIGMAGIDPARTAFFEDSVKNLAAAKTLGMTTVLVQGDTAREEGPRDDGFVPDCVISKVSVDEVRRVLPGLW